MSPMAGMSDTEAIRITDSVVKEQDRLLELNSKYRREEVRAKSEMERKNIALGEAEEAMGEMYRVKTYEIVQGMVGDDELASIIRSDPRDPDGKPSKDWADICVERALLHNEEWQTTKRAFYDAQTALMEAKNLAVEAQSKVMEISEALMTKNTEVRLRAALWQALRVENAREVPVFVESLDRTPVRGIPLDTSESA